MAPVVPISLSMVAQPLMPPPFRKKKHSHHQSNASSGHKKTLARARFCWVQSEFGSKTLVSFCCHLKKWMKHRLSLSLWPNHLIALGTASILHEVCTSSQHIYIQLPSGDFTSPWNPWSIEIDDLKNRLTIKWWTKKKYDSCMVYIILYNMCKWVDDPTIKY